MALYRNKTELPDESLREGLAAASAKAIIKTVIDFQGIDLEIINSKSRKFEIVVTRQLIHYFLSVDTNRSWAEIALNFGNNHATAMHSIKSIEGLIVSRHDFKLIVIKLSREIINYQEKKKLQLIGKVSGLKRSYAEMKFKASQLKMEAEGYEVWNPIEHVPTDITYGEEMRICLRNLIDGGIETVALQPDWITSGGSQVEYAVSNALRLEIIRL